MPYDADTMFGLVADIGAYPSFIPWCDAVRTLSITQATESEVVIADLVVSFKAFRETIRTRAVLADNRSSIAVSYIDGPLKNMNCVWRFHAQPDGACLVEFEVEYEFRSGILEKAAGLFFGRAMDTIVDAFKKRADEIFGNSERGYRVSPASLADT